MSNIHDIWILDCKSYEDYLDTFITRNDLCYIRNIRFCRMLVELGYRSKSDIYTPEQFEKRKAAVIEALWPTKKMSQMFSYGMMSKDPVLIELANREKANNQKIVSTIIFLKYRLKSGFELSGYIDYDQSLRKAQLRDEHYTDWEGVFQERVMLRPKPQDLSYYDWHKGIVHHNNSDNYAVLHDVEFGLIFMHKGDHKKICVDVSQELYKANCSRSMYHSDKYGYVIFYDHIIRKKI